MDICASKQLTAMLKSSVTTNTHFHRTSNFLCVILLVVSGTHCRYSLKEVEIDEPVEHDNHNVTNRHQERRHLQRLNGNTHGVNYASFTLDECDSETLDILLSVQNTRNHSSRMCTDSRSGLHLEGYTLPPGKKLVPGLPYPRLPCGQMNTCEKITFPQLRWRSVTM